MPFNLSCKKLASSVRALFRSHSSLKKAQNELKEQIEDHLEAINENTNEIQANYEHSLEIEEKINKIAERIDEISMVVGLSSRKKNDIPKLTIIEKQIFLALYKLCDEQEYASYYDIARMVNVSETLVMSYITILIEKGIPIIKSYSGSQARVRLSSYFKNIQTKKNILRVNHDVTKQAVLQSFVPGR